MRLTSLVMVVLLAVGADVAAEGARDDFSVARFPDQDSHARVNTGSSATSDGLVADFWNLDTRVVLDRWVLETGYTSVEPHRWAPDAQVSGHSQLWRMATGFYVVQNTEVKLAYDKLDVDSDVRTDRFALDVTHLRRMKNGMSWSMQGFVAQLKRDSAEGKFDGTDAEVSAGWFFRDNLGVGARFALGDREGSGDFTRYEAFADYQLTGKASLGVSYVNERIDDYNQKTGALMLEFRYRQ